MADPQSKDEIISSFVTITGVSTSEAHDYLTAANWDNSAALAQFYQNQEEAEAAGSSSAAADAAYTGPRTLDGRPAPQSQSASASSATGGYAQRRAPPQKKRGLVTMDSIRSGGGGGGGHGGHGHGHGHGDDDDDDDDDEEDDGRGPRDLFAGGEKSGLAVQDPKMGGHHDSRKVIRDIIAKAKANRGGEDDAEAGPSQAARSRFTGSGQTLGGEGVPSRTIPGPGGASSSSAAAAGGAAGGAPPRGGGGSGGGEDVQERVLHIWQDGFSIDDGPLHRFDDPSNAADLQMIRQGRAPLHLMNVQFGQAVDVKLHQHEENWHQPPRVYRPFSGEGRRLGSPVPGASSAHPPPQAASSPLAAASTTAASSSSSAPAPTVDESLPTLTIRVQLPDGTRLPARFNTTQTVGDVYEFVQRALPPSTARPWVLATTFPNKEHTDRGVVLGEAPEFKRGGAAVVKWV